MARLNNSELRTFSNTLLELYSPGPQGAFPGRVFAAIERHLSCDHCCYHEFSEQTLVRVVHNPDLRLDTNVFNHYVHQHPGLAAVITEQIRSPVKISDFKTLSQWQRTDLYNQFFRSEGLNYQLGYLDLNEGVRIGLALNRKGRDFSEEERALLDLMVPHLVQAFHTSQHFSRLSEIAEAGGQAWLVVDLTGHIFFESGKAVRWLVEYFGFNGALPAQIRDWLKRRASGLKNTNGLALTLRDYSIRRGTKRLIIRSMSPVLAMEQKLVLSESDDELDPRPLQILGITKREAEVLLWISQGKRNSEIAEILGTGSRTIGKHLERIFVKLGVETRTAAANMALEILRGAVYGRKACY
jgi:DNA-binding CsgD family transcriptional regulator